MTRDAAAPMIQMHDVDKWYGAFQALKKVNLTVTKGEKIVLCGPSGSGKSTLIRCINHLETIQGGEIDVAGHRLSDSQKAVDAVRKVVGMVFQQFNLFPHKTVLENCILAPMRVRKLSRADAEATARRYLERVRIGDQAGKYPAQLSGGVIFMSDGEIVEENDPETFFRNPQHARTKAFLGEILPRH